MLERLLSYIPELSVWQWIGLLYLSLWLVKLAMVYKDMEFIALAKMHYGSSEVPDDWDEQTYIKLMKWSYFLGALVALLLLLIPTLVRERLSFFMPYSRNQLAHYAKTGEW